MDQPELKSKLPPTFDAFTGGGEMGQLIRAKDWSKTPLGPIESWPASLRTTVSLCLASNFPIDIIWGAEHTQIYNDGYRTICGASHPRSLGESFEMTWASAWPVIGEPFEKALTGETSYLENQRIFVERNGYLEEGFFTLSLSPIRDDFGNVAGVFHPVTETTSNMLAERRTRTLRDILAKASKAKTPEEACTLSAATLTEFTFDLPFVLFYLIDDQKTKAALIASTGCTSGMPICPPEIDLANVPESLRPFTVVLSSGESSSIQDVEKRFGPIACGEYPELIQKTVAFPLMSSGGERPIGILVTGVSTRLPMDDSYQTFLQLLAGSITTAINNARAFQEERKRAEQLAEIDRAKTAFFSNVSHEFRTPLTLMLGPLEDNLADAALAPVHREREELAYRNALRLLRLVNTLLDFSRIEAGRANAFYSPIELSKFTADLSSVFHSAIEKAGLKLRVETPDLHEVVYVDREMWEKIVLNLISNAFKFTPQGEIVVKLAKVDESNRVRLTVRDTGIGIPKSELPRVFERFHRVEGAQGRTHEGTGIGLALIQELIKLHGGTISVQSELGHGTTFTVEIPLGKEHLPADRIGKSEGEASSATGKMGLAFADEASRWLPDSTANAQEQPLRFEEAPPLSSSLAPTPQPGVASLSGSKPERSRILLADDNADMRGYLKNLLQPHWDVEAVADGEAALLSALAHPPDLVLSDVMMPKIDGFELLNRLKKDPRTQSVPVVLLSARAGEEARVIGLQAGADDYLVKPFSAKELLARVNTHLEIGRLRAEADRQREKIYNVFMQVPAAVAFLRGENLTFEIANARYLELTGKGDSILGKPFRQALPEVEEEAFLVLEKVYRTGQPFVAQEYEATMDREGRQERKGYFSFSVEQMRDLEGKPEGIIAFVYEVTDQVKARRAMEKMTSDLQSAVNFRDEFMSIASHELKTPITSLKLQLQMTQRRINPELGQAPSPAKLAAVIETSLKQTDRLTELVENLLDVSRIQAGKLAFNFEEMDVGETVRSVVEHYSESLAQNKCPTEVQVAQGVVATWDRSRIEQVLVNLISNAIKYAPGKPIRISAISQEDRVVLIVQDFGPGIPKERQSKIFERYERATAPRNISGLGLGLYIVRQIISGHQGTIRVESEEGRGTRFVVDLPLLPLVHDDRPRAKEGSSS